MPFGLMNAPATSQHSLDIVLARYIWQSCLIYVDDFIIFSKDINVNSCHAEKILDCLAMIGVTIKLKRCEKFTVHAD